MHALYRQEGAMLRVEIMSEPEVTDFIGSHAGVLNDAMSQADLSDAMRRRLERSNYIFSGIKTFHELNEAFPSLLTDGGERKPFDTFLQEVQSIDATYNRNYLRAEYNFAQSSAIMAAKWEQIEQDGDRYNLQYRTANDGKVRPEHAALHGVTLPPSDPFWASYYPPNGWNCRCTVAQVRKSKYPTTDPDEANARGEEALQRDTRGIFRFNPGQKGKTFPDYNPYTIQRCNDCDIAQGNLSLAFVPENELCAACRIVRSAQCANRSEYTRLKSDPDYHSVEYNEENGGVKAIHRGHTMHDKDNDERFFNGTVTSSDLEMACQNWLFKWGHRAILRDESAMASPGQKLPSLDLELDGVIMDIRSITGTGYYGNALMAKNKHLGNVKNKTGLEADSVCLYFHDAALFSRDKMINDIEWFKRNVVEVGTTQRIKHVYCVVAGTDDFIKFDI